MVQVTILGMNAHIITLVLVVELVLFTLYAVSTDDAARWSYYGNNGPLNWSNLGYTECNGKWQSPINIVTDRAIPARIPAITFNDFREIPIQMNISNNGHSAVTSQYWRKQPTIRDGGLPGVFHMLQAHFHWGSTNVRGSEHVINGESYPMEVHIVFKNVIYSTLEEALKNGDGLAVLGAFYEVNGSADLALSLLQGSMEQLQEAGNKAAVLLPPRLIDLLPADIGSFYRYSGSLTTPGCQQAVTWTVFTRPIPTDSAQIDMFRKLRLKSGSRLVDNYRPPQPRYARLLLLRHDNSKASPAELVKMTTNSDALAFSAAKIFKPRQLWSGNQSNSDANKSSLSGHDVLITSLVSIGVIMFMYK